MSKQNVKHDLKTIIGENENVLWEGKPNKKCFILESIFNPLLPFAIIWLIVDLALMFTIIESGEYFVLLFFLVHLMPVWLYIGGVIFTFVRYRNISYLITDAGVYISGGLFSYAYEMKPFTMLSTVTIHRGVFDQQLGVGDVVLYDKFAIINIEEYEKVYKLVTKLQKDIYSDTQYPNSYRPKNNPGYNTKVDMDK